MANWFYGNIRFRGTEMDILNMLKNEIGCCGTDKRTRKAEHFNPVVKKNMYGEPTLELPESVKHRDWDYPGFYFKDGTRTLLGDGVEIHPACRYEYCWADENDERIVMVFDGFHEAYGIEPNLFERIGQKYGIDIHVNAWDCGNELYTNLEVLEKGTVVNSITKEYKDWAWESEMPQYGG